MSDNEEQTVEEFCEEHEWSIYEECLKTSGMTEWSAFASFSPKDLLDTVETLTPGQAGMLVTQAKKLLVPVPRGKASLCATPKKVKWVVSKNSARNMFYRNKRGGDRYTPPRPPMQPPPPTSTPPPPVTNSLPVQNKVAKPHKESRQKNKEGKARPIFVEGDGG